MPHYYPRHKTDHLVHFMITLFTCGMWTPVWIAVAIVNAIANSNSRSKAKRNPYNSRGR